MPRDINGVFHLDSTYNPVITNQQIKSAWANNTLNDMADAISNPGAGVVTPTGGTTPRTLADHFGDRISIQDIIPADKTGATDSSAAFIAFAAKITSDGGGNYLIPPGNYKVACPIGGVLCAISNCAGIDIEMSGVTITDSTTYTSAQYSTLFQFTNCSGIKIRRPKIISQRTAIDYGTPLGLSALKLLQGCDGVEIDYVQDGGNDGIACVKAYSDPASYKSKNMRIKVEATRVHYPYSGQFSGDSAEIFIDAAQCGRNFIVYGVNNNKIKVKSVDQQVTSIVTAYNGFGCNNIDVDYYDRDSTSQVSAAPVTTLSWNDITAATHRNISFTFNVLNPASSPRSHTFTIAKYNAGAGDPTGRGHILDGLKLFGLSDNTGVASVNHSNLLAGTFTAPDSFSNIAVENFKGYGASSTFYLPLQVLSDISTWKNVNIGLNIFTNNGTSGKVVFVGCTASNFTGTTGNTDTHDYIGCNITSGSAQNVANNKTFIDTLINSVKVDSYLITSGIYKSSANSLSGDLTPSRNIFQILGYPGSMLIRFKYYLTSDYTVTNPATKNETFGVKSLTVTQDGSAVSTVESAVANEATERTLNTASVMTVSFSAGGVLSIACTNYNGANARGVFSVEVLSTSGSVTVKAL